jgi:hypothetical protein
MKGRIESVIQMCNRIILNDEVDPFARLDAARLEINCSIGLVKLYSEGPKMLGSNLTNAIISGQQKLESQSTDRESGLVVRRIDNNDATESQRSETEDFTAEEDSDEYQV